MKSVLQEQRRSSVLVALVTIAFGVVLVFWPDSSVSLICALLGGALLISGLLYILGWFSSRRKAQKPAFMLIPGAVLAGLGVWLMTSSQTVIALIQYVFGAVILFHGVLDIQAALALAFQKMHKWWLDLLLALATLGLGLLILVNPFGTFAALVVLIGITLIYDGVSDLWLIWRLSRALNLAIRAQDEAAGVSQVIETEGHVVAETDEEKSE